MNLYWVDNAIYKLYESYVDPDTGEITDPEAFEQRFESLQISKDEIIHNSVKLYKNYKSDAEKIANEIKYLKERQTVLERKAERLKTDLERELGGEKYECTEGVVSWRKSTAVDVDEAICPADYITVKTTTQPDKKAITAALKAGESIPGCKLVERQNMIIK